MQQQDISSFKSRFQHHLLKQRKGMFRFLLVSLQLVLFAHAAGIVFVIMLFHRESAPPTIHNYSLVAAAAYALGFLMTIVSVICVNILVIKENQAAEEVFERLMHHKLSEEEALALTKASTPFAASSMMICALSSLFFFFLGSSFAIVVLFHYF